MRINLVILVLLILAPFSFYNAVEANEGFSILVKAYQNSGFNPLIIRTGTAEFESTMDRGELTPSEMELEREREEDEMVREQYKGDEQRIALELGRIHSSREESRRSVIQERLKILMSGNDRTYGGEPGEKYKRRFERHEYVPSLNQWVFSSIDLIFGTGILNPDEVMSKLQVHWIPNNRELVVRELGFGLSEFQEYGRFYHAPDSYIAFIIYEKINRETFTLPADFQEFSEGKIQEFGLSITVTGEIDYDDGAQAKVIEVKKEEKLIEKYHIDISRGYLCPYQYVADESGSYFAERTATEYIVEKNSGLYYPTRYREVISRSNGTDKTDTQDHLVPGTLRLNHAVSDHEFAIDIPEDARVSDFRIRDEPIRYVAMDKGTVSLAKGGYDFDKMKWLAREYDVEDYVPPSGGISSAWMQWAFTGIGIVLMLIALFRLWRRYVQ